MNKGFQGGLIRWRDLNHFFEDFNYCQQVIETDVAFVRDSACTYLIGKA